MEATNKGLLVGSSLGLRAGMNSAEGIPVYVSDIWPRAVGGISRGLPGTLEALEEALRCCVDRYQGFIPSDSVHTPPVSTLMLPRGRHRLCPVCNRGCECRCACAQSPDEERMDPEEGFVKIRTDVSGGRTILRPDQGMMASLQDNLIQPAKPQAGVVQEGDRPLCHVCGEELGPDGDCPHRSQHPGQGEMKTGDPRPGDAFLGDPDWDEEEGMALCSRCGAPNCECGRKPREEQAPLSAKGSPPPKRRRRRGSDRVDYDDVAQFAPPPEGYEDDDADSWFAPQPDLGAQKQTRRAPPAAAVEAVEAGPGLQQFPLPSSGFFMPARFAGVEGGMWGVREHVLEFPDGRRNISTFQAVHRNRWVVKINGSEVRNLSEVEDMDLDDAAEISITFATQFPSGDEKEAKGKKEGRKEEGAEEREAGD
eukprot:gene17903-biopygen2584